MTKVIIALPGRTFSGGFMLNLLETVQTLKSKNYNVMITNEYSSYVTYSRMKTLGLDVLRGADQKPFGGKIEYDVWVTVDSDIRFTPEQIIELIEDTNKYPVVSGLYRMEDLKHYACVKKWDVEHYITHGSFEFMKSDEEIKDKYISVAYNGMGFFACRKGVIEKLKYPYFSYPLVEIDGLRETCSEDVSFCKNLTAAGIEITVNTTLRVGHEKTLVI
jgi:hypothetical protein